MRRVAFFGVLVTMMCLISCAHEIDKLVTHNAAGGYIDACGDLPGLLGDDC